MKHAIHRQAVRLTALLLCLTLSLALLPGRAEAEEEETEAVINVKVLYSNVNSNDETAFARLLEDIYENKIKTYKGARIQVTYSSNFSELNRISAENTQFLIIVTPMESLSEKYGQKLLTYMQSGGCLWLCGEHTDYYRPDKDYISKLSAWLGVSYSLAQDMIFATGIANATSAPSSYDYTPDPNFMADLDVSHALGRENSYGSYKNVYLIAANTIVNYDKTKSVPVITYRQKGAAEASTFMIDTQVENGYLTVSADEQLMWLHHGNTFSTNTPWTAQILYNFLDRSTTRIETYSHTHQWKYFVADKTISAYCIAEEKKEFCRYQGEEHAVTITTDTPDMTYTGNPYDELKQEDGFQDISSLPKVTNTYYKITDTETIPLDSAPTDPGRYQVKATITSGSDTYEAISSFEITAAAPAATAAGYTGVYDGQPHSITVTAPDGAAVTYSTDNVSFQAENPSFTDAGRSTVYYKVEQNGLTTSGSATVEITPRPVGILWSGETAFPYDGQPHAPAAQAAGLIGDDTCTVAVTGAATQPGSYTAAAAGLSNPNYCLPGDGLTQDFTITEPAPQPPLYIDIPAPMTYPILVPEPSPAGGQVRASRERAPQWASVTVTAQADEGSRLEEVTVRDAHDRLLPLTEQRPGVYTFTMPASKVIVEAAFSPEETASTAGAGGDVPVCPRDASCPIAAYPDADPAAWYHDGVHACLEDGLLVGYEDGLLRPQADISRAEAVVMLWRLSGSPAGGVHAFTDVTDSDWYAGAVGWAVSEGLVSGYDGLRFGPNDPLTREQMAVILWRYAQRSGSGALPAGELSVYADGGTVSGYAVSAMSWACGAGLFQGDAPAGGAPRLSPAAPQSRAQTAVLLTRFADLGTTE